MSKKQRGRVDARLAAGVRERLRRLIQESNGGVQRRFAEAIGVAPAVVSRWLHPRKAALPSATELFRIAQRTGWSVDWLLFGKGPSQRGGAAADPSLGAQLRAFIVTHTVLDEITGIEITEDPGAGSRYRPVGPAVDFLPPADEELLRDTAILWQGHLQVYADSVIASEAINRRCPGLAQRRREELITLYHETQQAVREARGRDLHLHLALEVSKPKSS
jgi:transcriptional regulator with XRE-family HTH domain